MWTNEQNGAAEDLRHKVIRETTGTNKCKCGLMLDKVEGGTVGLGGDEWWLMIFCPDMKTWDDDSHAMWLSKEVKIDRSTANRASTDFLSLQVARQKMISWLFEEGFFHDSQPALGSEAYEKMTIIKTIEELAEQQGFR